MPWRMDCNVQAFGLVAAIVHHKSIKLIIWLR